jgi:response regulator RpfG family c-di-GMP phosphodiesterase
MILCDFSMPGMNGVELLGAVKAVAPEMPFILLSGLYETQIALDALRLGATDYLMKPALPHDVAAMVEKHLYPLENEPLASVRQALAAFLHTHKLAGGNTAALLAPLFDLLGFKRFETLQHSQRVAAYSHLIGVSHGLDADALQHLKLGALLHDIGKAAIPHNVLMKPASLNEEEWRVMKTHPQIGAELLAGIPAIAAEAEIVYSHHEKVDGSGYPRALRADSIPIGAKIFAVADALDAISSNRPYRSAASIASARKEVDRVAGTHFDPQVVESFHRVSDEAIDEVRRHFPDFATPEPDAPGVRVSR